MLNLRQRTPSLTKHRMSCILVLYDTLSRVVVDNVARSNPGQSSMLGFFRTTFVWFGCNGIRTMS